jgi:vacuolar-type H+-ATPase subunit E/Vma4
MALEDIFRALEEQANRDVEVALAEARAHAKAIRDEAEREAATTRANRILEAERAAKSRSAQSINSVRLEGRKALAAVKDRAVQRVFDDASASLNDIRSNADYPSVFRALADEALEGVQGEFEIWVDEADVSLAREVLSERGLSASVRPEISASGGLVVVTGGGRVIRRNTLQDRLDKLRGVAQPEVAEILFV